MRVSHDSFITFPKAAGGLSDVCELMSASGGERRVDGPDAADELREFRVCINRQSTDEVSVGRALRPRRETLPRRVACVPFVGEVKRVAFRQRAPRRSFQLAAAAACD